jgi:hypothetical protein
MWNLTPLIEQIIVVLLLQLIVLEEAEGGFLQPFVLTEEPFDNIIFFGGHYALFFEMQSVNSSSY